MLRSPTRRVATSPSRRIGALCAAAVLALPLLLTPPASASPGQPWNRGPTPLTVRADAAGAWLSAGGGEIGVALTALGRDQRRAPLRTATFAPGGCPGAEAELARSRGAVCEWWRVEARQAQHGAVLTARPPGVGALWLEVAVTGARVGVSPDGRLALLDDGAGTRLRYAHPLAWDATGRALPASLVAAGATGLRLVVDDRGAAYPVVVDPTVSSGIEANKAWAEFGTSVAGGDFDGDGLADVLVGAPWFMLNVFGMGAEGKAYVWKGRAGSLGPFPLWERLGSQQDGRFGVVVASAGDVDGDGDDEVLVGAPFFNGAYSGSGRISLYRGGSSGPASNATWTTDGEHANALMGACAGAGDVDGDGYDDVIVGAPNFDSDTTNPGRALLFRGGPGGLATTPAWSVSGAPQSAFGFVVGAAGDVNGDGYDDVIVGAYAHDSPSADIGRAFVYHGSASGLVLPAAWEGGGSQEGALFGAWVAGAGDLDGDGYDDVVVSAPDHDGVAANAGRVIVYRGSAGGLLTTATWSHIGLQQGEWLGTMAAGAGDVNLDGYDDLLVGAYRYSEGESDEGRVLLFYGGGAGLPDEPSWTAQGDQVNANLGIAVAGLGDLEGDGFPDLAAGARLYTSTEMEADEGRVFLWRGCPDYDLDGTCDAPQPDAGPTDAGPGPGPEPLPEPGPEPVAEPGAEPVLASDVGVPPDAGAPMDSGPGADTAAPVDASTPADTTAPAPDAASAPDTTSPSDTASAPETTPTGDAGTVADVAPATDAAPATDVASGHDAGSSSDPGGGVGFDAVAPPDWNLSSGEGTGCDCRAGGGGAPSTGGSLAILLALLGLLRRRR